MGEAAASVAAYFDLDGTLLDASSEKTLTGALLKRRPWRLPLGLTSWTVRTVVGLLTGRAPYDALRNRGHFTGASWATLTSLADELAEEVLMPRVPKDAHDRLAWHREQGHRLVLVTATVAPMAEAMGRRLGMDATYGCGPVDRSGRLTGSERGWSVPRRKGKVPVVMADAEANGHDLAHCWAYGNTHADSWFMRECGHAIAVNPEGALVKEAEARGWEQVNWRVG